MLNRITNGCVIMAVWVTLVLPAFAESDLSDKLQQSVRTAIDVRQSTQAAEEHWREEREKLKAEFDRLQQQVQWLQDRQADLGEQRDAVRERVEAKQRQIADIRNIEARILPFVHATAAALHELVREDLPFLETERQQRLKRLDQLVEDPDLAVSEKFRKVMEALLIEAEYGHTIETRQQTVDIDGRPTLVNLFRLGRVSLFYQSLDGKSCGYYDVAASAWRSLPGRYLPAIQAAIDIGLRRRPVELLSLPVGRIAGS